MERYSEHRHPKEKNYYAGIINSVRQFRDYFNDHDTLMQAVKSDGVISASLEGGKQQHVFKIGEPIAEVTRPYGPWTSRQDDEDDTKPSQLTITIPDAGLLIDYQKDQLGNSEFDTVRIVLNNQNQSSEYIVDKHGFISPPQEAEELADALLKGKKYLRKMGLKSFPFTEEELKEWDHRQMRRDLTVAAATISVGAVTGALSLYDIFSEPKEKPTYGAPQTEPQSDDDRITLREKGLGGYSEFYEIHQSMFGKYGINYFQQISGELSKAIGNFKYESEILRDGWIERRASGAIRKKAELKVANTVIEGAENSDVIRARLYKLNEIVPVLFLLSDQKIEVVNDGEIYMTGDKIHIHDPLTSDDKRYYYYAHTHEMFHNIDPTIFGFKELNILKKYVAQHDVVDYMTQYLESIDRIVELWARSPLKDAMRFKNNGSLLYVQSDVYVDDIGRHWGNTIELAALLGLTPGDIRNKLKEAEIEEDSPDVVNWWNIAAHEYMSRLITAYYNDEQLFKELSSSRFDRFRNEIVYNVAHSLVDPYFLKDEFINQTYNWQDNWHLEAAKLETIRLRMLSSDGEIPNIEEIRLTLFPSFSEVEPKPDEEVDSEDDEKKTVERPEEVDREINRIHELYTLGGAVFEGLVMKEDKESGKSTEYRAYTLPTNLFISDHKQVLLLGFNYDHNNSEGVDHYENTLLMFPGKSEEKWLIDPSSTDVLLEFNPDLRITMHNPGIDTRFQHLGSSSFSVNGRGVENINVASSTDPHLIDVNIPYVSETTELVYTGTDFEMRRPIVSLFLPDPGFGANQSIPLPLNESGVLSDANQLKIVHDGALYLVNSPGGSYSLIKDHSIDYMSGRIDDLKSGSIKIDFGFMRFTFRINEQDSNIVQAFLQNTDLNIADIRKSISINDTGDHYDNFLVREEEYSITLIADMNNDHLVDSEYSMLAKLIRAEVVEDLQ